MRAREYYKQIGVCPKCRKAKAFGNFVHCADCLEEIQKNNLKYTDRRTEYEKKNSERKKIQYSERKKGGLCVTCGKNASKGVYCSECYWKRLNRRRIRESTGREYGEAFRDRMAHGLCMYCENPQVSGYKFCKEHLETRRKCAQKMISRNDNFRKENDAFWKRKLKSSVST